MSKQGYIHTESQLVGRLGLVPNGQDGLAAEAQAGGYLDSPDTYSTDVEVDLLWDPPAQWATDEFDYEYSRKTSVTFTISMEARRYGIKDINVRVTKVSPISIEVTDAATMRVVETINIEIDTAQLKQVSFDGRVRTITVGELELYVAGNQVNYQKSTITVYEV